MKILYTCGQCGSWSEKHMQECFMCGNKEIQEQEATENEEFSTISSMVN